MHSNVMNPKVGDALKYNGKTIAKVKKVEPWGKFALKVTYSNGYSVTIPKPTKMPFGILRQWVRDGALQALEACKQDDVDTDMASCVSMVVRELRDESRWGWPIDGE